MKNKLKSVRSSSKPAVASQSKTSQSRAGDSLTRNAPGIFIRPVGDQMEPSGAIDLTEAEYDTLVRAFVDGDGIVMFMRNAALEKAAAFTSSPVQPVPKVPLGPEHQQLETTVAEVVAAIELLYETYWEMIDCNQESERMRAEGIISLATGVCAHLEADFGLACNEWCKARRVAASTSQRGSAEPIINAHSKLELTASGVVAAISLLCDVCSDGVNQDNEHRARQAKGIISLALGVSGRLNTQARRASDEWREARRAAGTNDQRRAA